MSRARRLRPSILVLLLSLVVSLASLTLVSSRGAFSGSTDNPGNSFTAAASFGGITQVQKTTAPSAGKVSSITATYASPTTQANPASTNSPKREMRFRPIMAFIITSDPCSCSCSRAVVQE